MTNLPESMEINAEIARIEPGEVRVLFERAIGNVRPELVGSPYIKEALRVIPVGGYRSAIGSFWNAVIDDLRNKVMYRSLDLFNKAVGCNPPVKTYEDFQNRVSDDQLIEGAYKIGVIGWEASKILKHAKETRHIFDGHPKSSDPSILKVLAMMEDCVRYVLIEPYPVQIVDIGDYLAVMDSPEFDRNDIAASQALTDIPEVYKNELANRLFSAYVDPRASTVLKSNIEFVAPILWPVLSKEIRIQIVRRVDQEIPKGDASRTRAAFDFIKLVGANSYLSIFAREYLIRPLVQRLLESLDNWGVENVVVRDLAPYAAQVPPSVVDEYVLALTQTYVGYMGSSPQYSRRNFYANGAATHIPAMFGSFDDRAVEAFLEAIRKSELIRARIGHPMKLERLRNLGQIALDRASALHPDRQLLEALVDKNREPEFLKGVGLSG